jgi:hypothetical protein
MLSQEALEDPGYDTLVIALVEQFLTELFGRMVPARKGVECRHSRRARI